MSPEPRPGRYGVRVRYFNTTGRCIPGRHYMLPAEQRLPGARRWIDRQQYFIVHAPRQTGKTTTLSVLAEELSREGKYVALRFSCESGETARDDVGTAELRILSAIRGAAIGNRFPAEWMPPDPWPDATPGRLIFEGLQDWALRCPLPLVLFFDEIDALSGDSLRLVLRQVRDGFDYRAHAFPASIALCGVRQLRDYKAAAGGAPDRIGGASPFNISVESLRIGDFIADEVAALYAQHTADTGQEFTPQAVERAFAWTQGQPWLVNELARQIVDEMCIEPPTPITAEHVDEAKERLIQARVTHLDSLVARLGEPRVQRIIEPIIAGGLIAADPAYEDDVSYVRDLGLIGLESPLTIANPIYRAVIVRELGARARDSVLASPSSFVMPDGRLAWRKLLEEFAAWWRQYGEILVRGEVYHEVAPQLIFLAYLTRIVNGGGFVDPEYGVGRGRLDILVRKPYTDADGKRAIQWEAIELKVRTEDIGDPQDEGLAQLDRYLDRMSLDSGTLVIFDRRPSVVKQRINPTFSQARTPEGRQVTILRA